MVSNNLKRDSALVGYGIQPGTVWSFLALLLEVESLFFAVNLNAMFLKPLLLLGL